MRLINLLIDLSLFAMKKIINLVKSLFLVIIGLFFLVSLLFWVTKPKAVTMFISDFGKKIWQTNKDGLYEDINFSQSAIAEENKICHKIKNNSYKIDDKTAQEIIKIKPKDIIIAEAGNSCSKKDSNVFVLYGSLTCHHCSTMFEMINKISTEENNCTTIIYRSFAMNLQDLTATKLLYCKMIDSKKRINLASILYSNQLDWAFSKDFAKKINEIGLASGLTQKELDDCQSSKETEDYILNIRSDSIAEIKISLVPILVNKNSVYEGVLKLEDIEEIIKNNICTSKK
jgi:protein-disulfide isomerase